MTMYPSMGTNVLPIRFRMKRKCQDEVALLHSDDSSKSKMGVNDTKEKGIEIALKFPDGKRILKKYNTHDTIRVFTITSNLCLGKQYLLLN